MKHKNATHGMSLTRTHRAWKAMRTRCKGLTSQSFKNYYLRGIKVDKRWDSFETFFNDMGECPDGMSIDRINNDEGYSPENCRWATSKQQMNNQRPKAKTMKSGYSNPGISYVSSRASEKKWCVRVGHKWLGAYKTFEEAKLIRLSWEVKFEVIDSGLLAFLC